MLIIDQVTDKLDMVGDEACGARYARGREEL